MRSTEVKLRPNVPRLRRPRGPRPLSPYEHLTGERFPDRGSPTDLKLDALLELEAQNGQPADVRTLVFEALDDGLDPHEIAQAYGLAERTVEEYVRKGRGLPGKPLWCVTGEHWWTCKVRGQVPWSCPDHPAGRYQGSRPE